MVRNNQKTIENKIIQNTNEIRNKNRLKMLRCDPGISYLGKEHSKKMAKQKRGGHDKNGCITNNFIVDEK